jgi:hypothetical protein
MKPWTNYLTELHSTFGYLFANWVPQQKIALGDYGRFQKGLFQRDGKLEDLGIKVQRGVPDESRALYQYHSANSSSAQLKLKGSGTPAAAAEVTAGLEIKFADANSVFFNAAGCSLNTLTNLTAIGNAVRSRLENGTWEYDWVVITTLIAAKSTTAIISSSSNGNIVRRRLQPKPYLGTMAVEILMRLAAAGTVLASRSWLSPRGRGETSLTIRLRTRPRFSGSSRTTGSMGSV